MRFLAMVTERRIEGKPHAVLVIPSNTQFGIIDEYYTFSFERKTVSREDVQRFLNLRK